jgi:outer membrane receptor protein involved in Fe transport
MQKRLISACLSGSALLCGAAPALAQTAPATTPSTTPEAPAKAAPIKKAPDAAVVPSVTVAGERPTNRIDRQVYDVKSDISSTNGTAADALNNVPSVNVDPDGTVSLRGSTKVQILVDGKPSAMLQGDNRGPALQAMGSDDIESIEVINNPGAEFGNEAGGGPILNLVMRRNRKPGGFATVNGNAGTAGRYNSAVNGSYNEGAWGFQGGLNVRHDGRNFVGSTSRDQLNPLTGVFAHTEQSTRSGKLNQFTGLHGTVNYNLSPQDTLTASINAMYRTADQNLADRYVQYVADTNSLVTSDYRRATEGNGESKNTGWGARWDHKGTLPGESLKVDLRVSASNNDNDTDYASVYAVRPPAIFDSKAHKTNSFSTHIVDFTGDYERPLAGGTLKAGYKIATNNAAADTLYTDINPVTQASSVNASRSNNFELDETVTALYTSYQMRLNDKWGVLGGLRAEYTDMDIDQITGNARAKNHYINYMPSLFATYKASETANIRFAYAHRIRRPQANDLNPYVMYRDELNVSSGNPNLKPTQTDSFEVGYETKLFGLESNLRGYFRRDTDAIVDRRFLLANNVLLSTKENGSGSHAGGLEFTVSGKITPALTLNTSGNLARNQQTVQDLTGNDVTRSASSLSGRARLNYAFNAQTQLQAALQMQGRQLSGTGYREANHTLNLSLRHALTPRLSMLLTVTDALNTNKMETIIDSATLRENTLRRFDGRVIYFGFSYRIGGAATAGEGGERGERGERRMPQRGQGGPGGPGGPGAGGPAPMDG